MTNLYIINEVLFKVLSIYDYTPGMAVIAAPSLERCRELFAEKFESDDIGEFDSAIKDGNYTVVRGVNRNEGVVSYVYGCPWSLL